MKAIWCETHNKDAHECWCINKPGAVFILKEDWKMIEKIEVSDGFCSGTLKKINELVDAVNDLQQNSILIHRGNYETPSSRLRFNTPLNCPYCGGKYLRTLAVSADTIPARNVHKFAHDEKCFLKYIEVNDMNLDAWQQRAK